MCIVISSLFEYELDDLDNVCSKFIANYNKKMHNLQILLRKSQYPDHPKRKVPNHRSAGCHCTRCIRIGLDHFALENLFCEECGIVWGIVELLGTLLTLG